MWEKFKTTCLILLILSSMLLTYRLWFGYPLLEEGTVPRYEYVFFTPPPSDYEIVQPSEAVFWDGEETHLFRRGDKEYQRLWVQAWRVLTQKADAEKLKRNILDDLEAARENAARCLVFSFHPPLPLEFIGDCQMAGETKIYKITFFWAEEENIVFWEGEEEVFSLALLDSIAMDALLPAGSSPCISLPTKMVFDGAGKFAAVTENGDLQEMNGPPAGGGGQEHSLAPPDGPSFPAMEGWMVEVPRKIFVEKESLFAAEIPLEKKDIQSDELVKAFFLDLSLARRIEEKDGAVYYTDGEKGLRIYASGLLEYTATRPGSSFRQQLPYGPSLQKGAESQSLYGGFLEDTYLYDVRETGSGHRLIWRQIPDGLVLEGENTSCEIFLEGQSVSYLRRNFWLAGAEVAARRPFRSFEEALRRALFLQQDSLPGKKATLLSLRPVYYLPAGCGERAIPAWAVNFAETGTIYLHWSTLEQL